MGTFAKYTGGCSFLLVGGRSAASPPPDDRFRGVARKVCAEGRKIDFYHRFMASSTELKEYRRNSFPLDDDLRAG